MTAPDQSRPAGDDPVAGPALPWMPDVPGTGIADEMNLGLLMIAYPQFAVTALAWPGRSRWRWQVVRRNAADPGLYAIITPDLTEAYQAMAADSLPAVPPPVATLTQARP